MKKYLVFRAIFIIILLLNLVFCKNKQIKTNVQIQTSEEIIINNEDIIFIEENRHIQINKNNIMNMSLETILLNNEWYIGEDIIYKDHLFFLSNNNYIINYGGTDIHVKGKYEVLSNSKIKLIYPFEIIKKIQAIEFLFPNQDELILELQRDYNDFYCIGRLFSMEHGIIIYSSIPSPENEEYTINDIIVIKKTGTLRINKLSKTRLRPSINAPLYQERIDFILEERGGNPIDWLNDSNAMLNVLFPGQIFDYDAISKHNDEIDGYSKPWYRLKIRNFSLPSYIYIWVYGEYVEELNNNSFVDSRKLVSDYNKNLIDYLFDNGLIKENYSKEIIMNELNLY